MKPDKIVIPDKLAVMVLPGATLFPHSILPLYIFEPRYREMVKDALNQGRMFCVAQLQPGSIDDDSNSCFFPVGGAGLIRVCRGNDDGTSHLILQGTARVRFVAFESRKSYRVAQIEAVPTRTGKIGAVQTLREQMDELCRRIAQNTECMGHIAAGLAELDDNETAADIVAGACVSDPVERQSILDEEVLERRYEKIIFSLTAMLE
jgi:ATP-dependent Lon protease